MTVTTIEADELREVMRRFPSGVTVVTTAANGRLYGMTANAVCSLSLSPPSMVVCFSNRSRTLGAAQASGRFAINVLSATQAGAARRFAATDLDPDAKWDGISYRIRSACPMLDGAVAWLTCALEETHAWGDHVVAIATVLDAEVREGDPLIYHDRRYIRLGPSGDER